MLLAHIHAFRNECVEQANIYAIMHIIILSIL